MFQGKIFIIGLPRTGTTSICQALLMLGYRVAHQAYTTKAMDQAQAIADTPVFCDYQALDQQFTHAKFIYLTRDLELWLPSIKQLLQRMYVNTTRTDGGFNPILKRCYKTTFAPFTEQNINDEEFLKQCYQTHYQVACDYFSDRAEDFISINVAQPTSYQRLLDFLSITESVEQDFKQINIKGKVTAWNDIKHPLKVPANLK